MKLFQAILALLLVAGAGAAMRSPSDDKSLGRYATSLEARTRGQKSNARLAAQRVDGVTLESGEVFSFNRHVGPWTPDRGYVIAPVSYDGELVADWGGGVCQTSTTLYNAALLAGLEVAERRRHTWAPRYVPPGRDAAVAQFEIDLKLRNPYPWPVRIRARASGESIGFEIQGRESGPMAQVESEPMAEVEPAVVVRTVARMGAGQRRVMVKGRPGVRVSVYRRFLRGPRAGERELVSQDSYPAMNRVLAVGASG